MRYDRMLSERHYEWGQDCPAIDLDFMLIEFNHGVPVAVVDYKYHAADISRTNQRAYEAISRLHNEDGRQIKFFIAKYWPETWAFRVLPVNESAKTWAFNHSDRWEGWCDFTEQGYVRVLYKLRKDALSRGDEMYIARLNTVPPPAGDEVDPFRRRPDPRIEEELRIADPPQSPSEWHDVRTRQPPVA